MCYRNFSHSVESKRNKKHGKQKRGFQLLIACKSNPWNFITRGKLCCAPLVPPGPSPVNPSGLNQATHDHLFSSLPKCHLPAIRALPTPQIRLRLPVKCPVLIIVAVLSDCFQTTDDWICGVFHKDLVGSRMAGWCQCVMHWNLIAGTCGIDCKIETCRAAARNEAFPWKSSHTNAPLDKILRERCRVSCTS